MLMIISFLLLSCSSKTNQGNLPEIPVDIDQNISLLLSEIAEEIKAIELELTDESQINTDHFIGRYVILSGDNIIINESTKTLVFNKDGKFVRSIGSRGQGPGGYRSISSIAIDEKNKHLIILSNSSNKIICYDMNGKFLKEIHTNSIFHLSSSEIIYINDEFLVICQGLGEDDNGNFVYSKVYRLNDEFRLIDSCSIRTVYIEGVRLLDHRRDVMFKESSSIGFYYNELKRGLPSNLFNYKEVVLRDTLYHFEKNQLIPELKLKFKNDGISGGERFIDLYSIYRSSRYIFSYYQNLLNKNWYYFCYDTKTGKGYNMQDGYTDDINNIDKPVRIRPLNLDTEMFYYLHTNMKPDDLEEPNPTLYIGRLKK